MPDFIRHIFLLVVTSLVSFSFITCKPKQQTVSARNMHVSPNNSNAISAEAESELSRLFVDGCSERMKGNHSQALKIFEACYKIAPNNPAVNYELGMIHKLQGRNEKALVFAKQAAADKKNEWYQLLLAECYSSLNQRDKLIKVREGLVTNFPANVQYKEDLAHEYALAGQYARSIKLFNEIENAYGVNEQLTLNKVKLFKSMNRGADAENELKKLLDTKKGEIRYQMYLSDFYIDTHQPEKAKTIYEKIIENDSLNADANMALYDYYAAIGNDARAFDCIKKAFRDPNLDAATKARILSDFYTRAENGNAKALAEGSELSRLIIEVHPKSPEASGAYADFLRLNGNLGLAAKHYYLFILGDKKHYNAWVYLIMLDASLNQMDSLERHSAACAEIFPSQPEPYKYNAIANLSLKNYKKAVQSLNDGLEFVSNNKTLRNEFLSMLGDANYYLGDYPASDKAYEDALKINADNVYILNNYAYFLSLRKTKLDVAEKFAKRANELKPGERTYMDTYGWVLFVQKKYAEAEVWLRKAAMAGPNDAEILEHYGDVLFRLDRKDEAMEYWKKAGAAGGENEALTKKLKTGKLDD